MQMLSPIRASIPTSRQQPQTIKIGQPAPEISLPDPNGKIRKLSIVQEGCFVDFGAMGGPCRKANPMLWKYTISTNLKVSIFSAADG